MGGSATGAGGNQSGDPLVKLLAAQCGTELDRGRGLRRARDSLGIAHAGRSDHGFAGGIRTEATHVTQNKQLLSGNVSYTVEVPDWSFLTNHARVLVCIARDPGLRLRDIAASLGITERTAHGIVADLTLAGYVMKTKDGRRNRYQIQAHVPLPEPGTRAPAIGEILAVLLGDASGIAAPAAASGITGPADADAADREPRGPAKSIKVIIAQAGNGAPVGGQADDDPVGPAPQRAN